MVSPLPPVQQGPSGGEQTPLPHPRPRPHPVLAALQELLGVSPALAAEESPFSNVIPFPGRVGLPLEQGGAPAAARTMHNPSLQSGRVPGGGGVRVRPIKGDQYSEELGFNTFGIFRGKGKEPVATVEVTRVGKNEEKLHVGWIGGESGKVDLGPAATREVLTQLRRYFPGVESVRGLREGGARERSGSMGRAEVALPPDVKGTAQGLPQEGVKRVLMEEAINQEALKRAGGTPNPKSFIERRSTHMMEQGRQKVLEGTYRAKAEQEALDAAFAQEAATKAARGQKAQLWLEMRKRPQEVTPALVKERGLERGLGLREPRVDDRGMILEHTGVPWHGVTTDPLTGRSSVMIGGTKGPVVPFQNRGEALEWLASRPLPISQAEAAAKAALQAQRMRNSPYRE